MSGDDWDLDRDDGPAVERLFRTIPGVYNYCDHWCERCVFQLRCAVFRDRVLMQAEFHASRDEAGAPRPEPAKHPTLTAQMLEEADVNVEADIAIWEARRRRREADPLSLQASQYAELARTMMHTLRSEVDATADPVLLAGLDVIEWHMYAIQVKVRRALASLGDPWLDDAEDDPVQTDANGTAKLVRLMIAESRGAWDTLLQGAGQTHPATFADMLDRLAVLDAGMAAKFPRAMEFVRPGFDE